MNPVIEAVLVAATCAALLGLSFALARFRNQPAPAAAPGPTRGPGILGGSHSSRPAFDTITAHGDDPYGHTDLTSEEGQL